MDLNLSGVFRVCFFKRFVLLGWLSLVYSVFVNRVLLVYSYVYLFICLYIVWGCFRIIIVGLRGYNGNYVVGKVKNIYYL